MLQSNKNTLEHRINRWHTRTDVFGWANLYPGNWWKSSKKYMKEIVHMKVNALIYGL